MAQVVVTGLGCVSPLGGTVATTWEAAVAGRAGVSALWPDGTAEPRADELPVRIGAPVVDDLALAHLPPKDVRRMDRAIQLALTATDEALRDAELVAGENVAAERAGVAIGSGIGGVGTLLQNHRAFLEKGPRRVSPFFIPMTLSNMPAGLAAIHHGLKGPNFCHVTACASGAHSIGEAVRAIERGDADVMLAGGTEAAILPLVIAGFASMQALSKRDCDPAAASCPFDEARDGFVLGEGAAILVLEREAHARARGAKCLARVSGYGAAADAAHMAAPDVEAGGAIRCMEAALADADLAPADVDHINAHATSTPAGDQVEAESIRRVFGASAEDVAVSATKSMTGHLLGAAGALEAVLCIQALQTGTLPPTINLDHPDPACALDHVSGKARQARVRVALSNSFGFGGVNAALIFQTD